MNSQVVGREILTPRPEAGELLEVGLGTIDGEGCDDALHFILVGERTEDNCNHNGVSTKRNTQRIVASESPS